MLWGVGWLVVKFLFEMQQALGGPAPRMRLSFLYYLKPLELTPCYSIRISIPLIIRHSFSLARPTATIYKSVHSVIQLLL